MVLIGPPLAQGIGGGLLSGFQGGFRGGEVGRLYRLKISPQGRTSVSVTETERPPVTQGHGGTLERV